MSNVSWNNVTGTWNTGADWSTGQPPGTLDVAILSSAAAQDVIYTTGTSAIAGLIASTDPLTVAAGALIVNGTASFGAGLMVEYGLLALNGNSTAAVQSLITGGTLAIGGDDTLAVSGSLLWGGVDVTGPGTLVTSGYVTLSDATTFIDGGLTWVNSGTVLDNDSQTDIDIKQPSSALATTIVNQAGGTFDLTFQSYEGLDYFGSVSAPVIFNNAGLLEASSPNGSPFLLDATVNNTGTISVTSGELRLEGGTLGGTLAIAAGAELRLGGTITGVVSGGGTLVLDSTSFAAPSTTLSNQVLSDGLAIGSGQTVAFSGLVALGSEFGPGTLQTSGTAYLTGNIDGGLTWVNTGTVLDEGPVTIDAYQASSALANTIINQAGATFDIENTLGNFANVFKNDSTASAPLVFNNAGLLEETDTNAAILTFSPTLNNTGTLSVEFGTLSLTGGLTGQGLLEIDVGAALSFGGRVSQDVLLNGSGAKLDLSQPGLYTGTIDGMATGDAIEFTSVAYDATAVLGPYTGGVLAVETSTGGLIASLNINAPSVANFQLVNDDGYLAVVACYLRGTGIATPKGDVAIETLQICDLVMTESGVARPIKWIGRRSYAPRFAACNPDVLPVCIRAGALEENMPRRDLYVSPLHAMYLEGVLVPAIKLVNGASIFQVEPGDAVEYIHLELDSHDVILAEGAPSESFVDDDSRGIFYNAAEYVALYPNAPCLPAVYCAPRVTEGFALEEIRRRLALRAGLRAADVAAPFRGNLEYVGAHRIEGWAQNPEHPSVPVCLDILVDGEVVAQVLANRFRGDLLAAGIGDGRHAFCLTLSASLNAEQRQSVVVRRSADGALLPCAEDVLLAA